jgi:hypothetical protein
MATGKARVIFIGLIAAAMKVTGTLVNVQDMANRCIMTKEFMKAIG